MWGTAVSIGLDVGGFLNGDLEAHAAVNAAAHLPRAGLVEGHFVGRPARQQPAFELHRPLPGHDVVVGLVIVLEDHRIAGANRDVLRAETAVLLGNDMAVINDLWSTRFHAVTGETTLPGEITFVPNVMFGDTHDAVAVADFLSASALFSRRVGPLDAAVRIDHFRMKDL